VALGKALSFAHWLRSLGPRLRNHKAGDQGSVWLTKAEHRQQITRDTHDVLLNKLAYVSQEDVFPEGLTVDELLLDAFTFSNQEQAVDKILDEVGLPTTSEFHRRSIQHLSGGEKRRLSIARALCSAPRILLLDEPTSGLDLPVADELMLMLRQLCDDSGLTILTTSHLPSTLHSCDRVLVMAPGGTLLADYSSSEFKNTLHNHSLKALFSEPHRQEQPSSPETASPEEAVPSSRFSLQHFIVSVGQFRKKVMRDNATVSVLLLQPILLSLFIFATQALHDPVIAPDYINYFLGIAALWVGMSTSVREIVTTRQTTAIDEIGGLSTQSWFWGKLVATSLTSIVGIALLVSSTYLLVHTFGVNLGDAKDFGTQGFSGNFVILSLTSISGVLLGLLISAWSGNERQAVSAMPAVLLPHVLFSRYATTFMNPIGGDSPDPYRSLEQGFPRVSWHGLDSINEWLGLLMSTKHASLAMNKSSLKDFYALLVIIAVQGLLAWISARYCYRLNIRQIR